MVYILAGDRPGVFSGESLLLPPWQNDLNYSTTDSAQGRLRGFDWR